MHYSVHGSKLEVVRAPNNTGTYTMLRHGSNEKGNEKNPCRHGLLNKWRELWNHDGLNSLKYRLISFDLYKRFYHIHVDTEPPSDICGILKSELVTKLPDSNQTSFLKKMAPVPNFTIADHCGIHDRFSPMKAVSSKSSFYDDNPATLIILMMFITFASFATVHIFRKLSRIRITGFRRTPQDVSDFIQLHTVDLRRLA
ncbi:unnamed protein product [Anisakis simplex]|uniref:Phosphatidylinositol-glycan biosynthesis class X protein n=1 Tax=Anisakis simplex TaxID=6269 RepID=A0A0M3KE00_ANISI|nr:unnamed protein product [Anisakis simplex]